MAGLGPGGEGRPITDINVTPFVDVVLVLLIIFMVTAPAMFAQSIPLELPAAATGEAAPGTDFGIVVLADGAILLDGDRVDEEFLRRRLQEAGAEGEVRALISADRTTEHGAVVGVLDLLRQEGVEKFAINVVPRQTP